MRPVRVASVLLRLALAGEAVSCLSEADLEPGFTTVSTAGGGYAGMPGKGGSAPVGAGGAAESGGQAGQSARGGAGGGEDAGLDADAAAEVGADASGEEAGCAGAAGNAGGAAGASGEAGAGGGCSQADLEPNDDLAAAHDLGDITDCDTTGAATSGTVDGPEDEDWYTLHGDDVFGCSVDPVISLTTAEPLSLCVYFLCDSGETNVTCNGASKAESSAMGDPGCCGEVLTVAPKVNCGSTLEDSTHVWIRVRTELQVCAAYGVSYHY